MHYIIHDQTTVSYHDHKQRRKDRKALAHTKGKEEMIAGLSANEEINSGDLNLYGLGLFGLRRRQLVDSDSEHTVLADGRDSIGVGILGKRELPHELANPSLHPQILSPFFLFILLPLPLAAYQKHVIILHLHLNVPGFQAWHVDHEHVVVRVLLHVRRSRSHCLRVAHVCPRRSVQVLLCVLCQIHDSVQSVEQWRVQIHQPDIHFLFFSCGDRNRMEASREKHEECRGSSRRFAS
ncbi:hypothetical protein GmHk_04G009570 [Glycine max]|nr:hypothetical protein GmHk_04G009570 [Glycine max]